MSFKSKNASPFITPLLLLLLITINFSNNSPKVNGDSNLVQNVCQKTPYPKDCLDCFNQNSGAVQMNMRELAGSAVYCTYNLSQKLEDAFVGLAAKSDEPHAKEAYHLCGSALHQFAEKMVGTQTWWWNYNDEEAKKDFNGAKGDYVSCHRSLVGLNSSAYEVDQFKTLNNLYLDSFNIILQSEKIGRKF